MIILVYCESMLWSIIANSIVYVKYKNVYKTKLMVLNGRVFPAGSCVAAMKHVRAACMRQPMGDKMSSAMCVKSNISLTAHISLFMLHYHGHSRLGYSRADSSYLVHWPPSVLVMLSYSASRCFNK